MKRTIMVILLLVTLMSIVTGCGLSDDTIQSSERADNESKFEEEKISVLTVDNCPALEAVLYSKDASGEDFANRYDGCYVEFEACIYENSKSPVTLDRTITVTGEFSAEGEASGWVIKIGYALGANIDESVIKGDLVVVKGKVDADRSEYYKCLYIVTESLSKKK